MSSPVLLALAALAVLIALLVAGLRALAAAGRRMQSRPPRPRQRTVTGYWCRLFVQSRLGRVVTA